MGLEVAEIVGSTQEKLKKVVPSLGSVQNPVDLTGQSLSNPALIKEALEVMLAADDFDIIVPLLLMSKATAEMKAKDIWQAFQGPKGGKILAACWPEGPREWIQYLMEKGIFVAVTPTRCAQALSAVVRYADFQRAYAEGGSSEDELPDLAADCRANAMALIQKAKRKGLTSLSEYDAKKVLEIYGIPITKEKLARSLEEALAMARGIGYPLAAKLVSPDIPHKTEAGVIALDIHTEEQLAEKYQEIRKRAKEFRPEARIEGILIQEMVKTQGIETIVGISQEPPFGPTLLFGLGGIFVEIIKDVSVRVLPVTRKDVRNMISEIRGYQVLQGTRGRRPADLEAIIQVLLKTARLAAELKDVVAEVDINPLIVGEANQGAKAADALITLVR
jgi:acetyltransferase